MVYYIIEKLEAFAGQVQRRPVGITTVKADAEKINQAHAETFGAWVQENKRWLENGQLEFKTYFDNNPPVLVAEWQTDCIENLKIEQWRLR